MIFKPQHIDFYMFRIDGFGFWVTIHLKGHIEGVSAPWYHTQWDITDHWLELGL